MNLLELEGSCLLSLIITENGCKFYTDGLDVYDVFELVAYTGEIKIGKFALERGRDETYKCYREKDFKPIKTYSDLIRVLKNMNDVVRPISWTKN